MRTICLTEYQPKTETLDQHELTALVATGLVGVTPTGEDTFELRAGSVVGTLILPRLRVLIRPKIGLSNTFFLLSYGSGLVQWREDAFPYAADDFYEAVAWLLEAEVRRAAPLGLVRDYRQYEESLPTLRGRIDVGSQVTRRLGQPIPLDCRYQEYDEDTPLNRVIKAGIQRLLGLPGIERRVANQLRHHLRLFAAVADVSYAPSAVPDLRYSRLTSSWEAAGRIAELILRADSVRDTLGEVQGASFTVDMNKLFEQFIERVTAEIALEHGWTFDAQARRRLSDSVFIKPDLLLRRGDRDCAVGDAKYKALSPADWPHADLPAARLLRRAEASTRDAHLRGAWQGAARACPQQRHYA